MAALPTRRLLLLALGAVLPMAAATLLPWTLYMAALYLAALAVAVVVDLRLGPGLSELSLEREYEKRLSLGEANPVTLILTWLPSRGSRPVKPLRLRIRDLPPSEVPSDSPLADGIIQQGGQWSGRYYLHPVRRGDYLFGEAYLRLRMPLGLLIRQYSFPITAPARVYPSLRAVRRYEMLSRSGRLQEMGLRHARLSGAGNDFERLREYLPDDDYRRIAWKATARRRSPVTVEYETERSQSLVLAIDAGRLMGAPIGPMEKLDYAVNAALMMGYVASQLEDRVGLLVFADRVMQYLPPARGRRQFHLLLESLYKVQSQPVEPDPGQALAYLALRQPRRSLVVLFTDLEEAAEAEGLVAHLSLLARKHLPLCIAMGDPDVARLAGIPPMDVGQAYERVVAQRMLDERKAVLERLERRGVLTLDAAPDTLTAEAVDRYLEIKARVRL